MNEKSILIFGAGKIGRSFIGQLFGQSGYKIVFADIDQEVINELNRQKSYPVVIKGKKEKTILVKNVSAISGSDSDALVKETAQTSIVAISVGKNALEKVIPVIAQGLALRYKNSPDYPLDIIIAENMRSAAEYIRPRLLKLLPEDFPFEQMVGLVETSIGKMVPIMTKEELSQNLLVIYAEPYNTLILDKKGFKGPIPDVAGLSPKDNMKAWVDRKAFIHNMGHAATAWMGNYYHPQADYLYEVLADKKILKGVKESMLQAAEVLYTCYPDDFTMQKLEAHVDDLLERFQNRALKDTIFRVGRDIARKLGIDDRFAGIILMAHNKGMDYDRILGAMAYGLFFSKRSMESTTNQQDAVFRDVLKKQGLEKVLEMHCGFNAVTHAFLIEELKLKYLELKEKADERS